MIRPFVSRLRLLPACLALPLAVVAAGAAPAPPPRPNILFILTDDQGWPTLGCFGARLVATPHLDSLARDGMKFTDAYVMPQCTPTRAALLTGQHTARTRLWHVIPNYGYPYAPLREPAPANGIDRDTFTLAKGLRAAGYATACIGKWHLTTNNDGQYVALKQEAAPHYGFDYSPPPPTPTYHQQGDKGVGWLTDRTIEFIGRHRDRPWFAYLAHHTVHGPVVAPAALVARFRARGAPESGLHNATYLAALEHLDQSVGRLLAQLDEWHLRANTVVVFLSDNGGIYQALDIKPFTAGPGTDTQLRVEREEFSNAPLRAGKGSLYEGGIRVPCLVRWPGVVPAGRIDPTPVHVVDWMPTLFALAGAAAPATHRVDGTDLGPLLRGDALPERALFWYAPFYELRWAATPAAVVRRGDWKLIEHFGDRYDADLRYVSGRHVELFNLRADPGERTNLAGAQPGRAAALVAELHALIRDCGAENPGPNPRHDPARPFKESRSPKEQ
jgi:arylsulfatase A-like enzyme